MRPTGNTLAVSLRPDTEGDKHTNDARYGTRRQPTTATITTTRIASSIRLAVVAGSTCSPWATNSS